MKNNTITYLVAFLAICIVVLSFGSDKDIRAYNPDGDLRQDSMYQKTGTDSVFRYLRSNGTSKFLYRLRVSVYNSTGLVSNMVKYYADTLTPTTGSSQTIDISGAGFTKVLSIQAQVQTSTTTANDVPMVAVKDYSTTSVTLNIVQGNTTSVTVLGTTVAGLRFLQTPSASKIHILVIGY